jgi:hypothetical protein
MTHVIAIVTEEEYRTQHPWRLRFNQQHESLKNFRQRRVCGKSLQNLALSAAEVLLLFFRIGFERKSLEARELLRFVGGVFQN